MMSLEWATQLTDIMGLDSDAAADSGDGTQPAGFDDLSLIRRILEQQSQAHFRLLVERHQKHVFELVCSVLGPRHRRLAEETCQEVFIKVYRKLADYRAESSFSTWAYRIAYNTALDRLRVLKRRPPETPWDPLTDQRTDSRQGPHDQLAIEQQKARVQAAVETLPELYQTLVHLHYWRGLTITEIAGVLQSKPGTIKSYLFRARARITDILRESE
jgi:RNA polymerase sigma-70 factor (ECF subfamily)